MDKRPFFLAFFFLFCVGAGLRLWTFLQPNQRAVAAISHLSLTTSCAIDEPYLQWEGEPVNLEQSAYLQGAAASALQSDLSIPSFDEWDRDPRLYYWFMAQMAVKNKAYTESLDYLAAADAGSILNVAGHFSPTPVCAVINWSIASEIGYIPPPNWLIQGMESQKDWVQLEETLIRLLRYDSQRVSWRLSLAKAYMATGETAVAEEILEPVLNDDSSENREQALSILGKEIIDD